MMQHLSLEAVYQLLRIMTNTKALLAFAVTTGQYLARQ